MLKDEEIYTVRHSVTMKQLAEAYGYRLTRTGLMACPFHNDRHPSMKVYPGDRGYHCFVCGVGGDVIDFVMRHDKLGFEQAVRHIADLFGIQLSDGNTTMSAEERKRMAKLRTKREAAQKASEARTERMVQLSEEIFRLKQMQEQFEPLGGAWCATQRKVEACEAEWDELFAGEGKELRQ